MDCPKCHVSLADSATYCGCGWKKLAPKWQSKTDEPVPCAHEACNISAMSRIMTKTGWANLCWRHYDEHFYNQAIDNLDKYGMEIQPDETRAEWVLRMRDFVKSGFRQFQARRNAI